MRLRLLVCLLACLGLSGPLLATNVAPIDAATAVNIAGMQRMLSQRIAKDYLMIASEVRVEQANRQLDDSLAQFDSNLQALDGYAGAPALQQPLGQVQQLWQDYRLLVLQAPQRQTALQVLEQSERLLAASEALVQAIEQHSGQSSVGLVNLSGRQRMLSQRIALLYLASSWKVDAATLHIRLAHSVEEFDSALRTLNASPHNDARSRALLAKVDAQWRYSQSGFRLSADARYVPTVISTTCDSLLNLLDQLTRHYAERLAQG